MSDGAWVELTHDASGYEHAIYTTDVEIKILEPIKYAGHVDITQGYRIGLEKYPNWFHRAMMRLIFGWRFERYE